MKEKIRGSRKLGLILVLVGCVFFCFRGVHDERLVLRSCDFLPVYSGARCLLAGLDPYNADALLKADGTAGPPQSWFSDTLSFEGPVYPPTSLFVVTPFAVMRWRAAHRAWLAFLGLMFSIAICLMWELCADDAPLLAGALLGAFAATSTFLLMTANPTGIAVSLCAIGVWSALRERVEWLGVLCLALSLLLKPQIGGFIWLYLLLAAPAYRRFAWKTLAVASWIGLPAILWVSLMPASRNWLPELYGALAENMGPGGTGGPGIGNPTSFAFLNLQSVLSVIWANPRFYGTATYAITLPMIGLWLWTAAKGVLARRTVLVGLASGALLSLLPVYHRPYDVRLLLLMFPAVVLLWAERDRRGWLAMGGALVMTAVSLNWLLHFLQVHRDTMYAGPLWMRLAGRPYPFVTLAVAMVFLWMYVRVAREDGLKAEPGAAKAD